MDKIISIINSIKEQKSIDIQNVYSLLSDLQTVIKEELCLRLEKEKFHPDFTPVIDKSLLYWTYPIKWEIKSEPYVEKQTIEFGRLNIELATKQRLLIFTTLEDVDSNLKSFVEEMKEICGDRLMIRSEKALIRNLHELYLEVNKDDKPEVQKLIAKNFNIEYVECKDEYNSVDYFDLDDSDVEQPQTRDEALISKLDNSCIIKGRFLRAYKNDN